MGKKRRSLKAFGKMAKKRRRTKSRKTSLSNFGKKIKRRRRRQSKATC